MLTDEQLKELTKGSRQSLLFMRKVAKAQEDDTTRIFKQLTWCAYCGKEFPLDTVTADQVGEHIAICEKHPLYQANKEINRLREGWTHCADLCHQYEKQIAELTKQKDGLFEYTKELEGMIEEMKQDNTSMAEHNVELEKKLDQVGSKLDEQVVYYGDVIASKNDRIKELESALKADATDLWKVTNAIKKEIASREWIQEGRGCYAWDDNRYKDETRLAFDAVLELIKNVQHPAQIRFHELIK